MPEVERFEVEKDNILRADRAQSWMVVRYTARGPTARGEKIARGMTKNLAVRMRVMFQGACVRTDDPGDTMACGAALPCVRHEHPGLAATATPRDGPAPKGATPGIVSCTAHRIGDDHAGRAGIDLWSFDLVRWHIVTRDGRIECVTIETRDAPGFTPGLQVRGSHGLTVQPHASNTIRVRPLSPMEMST